ncbi:MAG: hypothetical protein WKG52_12990 [Variovorax sp.]
MTDYLSDDELAVLREHGIVLFADRVIFDARAPMTPSEIDAVQAVCAGPIPEQLAAMWRQTAGGRIDYDLSLRMNGNEEAVSWSALFGNGSSVQKDHQEDDADLQGWIAHELEGSPNGKLTALPFGGFEHCDRIYAVVEPGAEHGHILAWKQGLPEAWTHAMHEDATTSLATDLHGAFAALHLDEDPLEPAGDYFTGQTLLEYLDERHETHGLAIELMDKLVDFYRRRSPGARLAEGTLAGDARSRAWPCVTRSRPTIQRWSSSWPPPVWHSTDRSRQRHRDRSGAQPRCPRRAGPRRRAGWQRRARPYRQRGFARAGWPAARARRRAQSDCSGGMRGLRRASGRTPYRRCLRRNARRPAHCLRDGEEQHAGRARSGVARSARRQHEPLPRCAWAGRTHRPPPELRFVS